MMVDGAHDGTRRSTSEPSPSPSALSSSGTALSLSSSNSGLTVGAMAMPPGRFALPGSLAPLTNVDVSNLPLLPGPPSTVPPPLTGTGLVGAEHAATSSSTSSSPSTSSGVKSQVDFLLN